MEFENFKIGIPVIDLTHPGHLHAKLLDTDDIAMIDNYKRSNHKNTIFRLMPDGDWEIYRRLTDVSAQRRLILQIIRNQSIQTKQETMTPQEIAKAFYNIDFVAKQCDAPAENNRIAELIDELKKMPVHHALVTMMHVIECRSLEVWNSTRGSEGSYLNTRALDNPFSDLKEFKYLNNNLDSYHLEKKT